MTEEEEQLLEKFFKKPIQEIDYWDIPAYIRKREEDEARALSQMEEDWRQQELERKERERIEQGE